MVSGPNWHQICDKICHIPKRISVLTSLKVSSLPCKWLFYRPENIMQRESSMELNSEGLECKNGIFQEGICLVIITTPRVIVIKISKMIHFLYFFAGSKKSVTV